MVKWEIWWQMVGQKHGGSSSAVGSVKKITEETTETDKELKRNRSWWKGNRSWLECPLTLAKEMWVQWHTQCTNRSCIYLNIIIVNTNIINLHREKEKEQLGNFLLQ